MSCDDPCAYPACPLDVFSGFFIGMNRIQENHRWGVMVRFIELVFVHRDTHDLFGGNEEVQYASCQLLVLFPSQPPGIPGIIVDGNDSLVGRLPDSEVLCRKTEQRANFDNGTGMRVGFLNEFLKEGLERRQFAAGTSLEADALQAGQLVKSKYMLQQMAGEYEHFPYNV